MLLAPRLSRSPPGRNGRPRPLRLLGRFETVGVSGPNEAGLGEREPGGLENFSDRIYSESQSLKRMGTEEGQAVIAAGEDKGDSVILVGGAVFGELEGLVERADGELGVFVLDHARDGDLRGGDHLDVDALFGEN